MRYNHVAATSATPPLVRTPPRNSFVGTVVTPFSMAQLQDVISLFATFILSLPNGEVKYEFLFTVNYKAGEVILWFDNYLYTGTAPHFLDACIGLVDVLGEDPHVVIGISLPLATKRLPISDPSGSRGVTCSVQHHSASPILAKNFRNIALDAEIIQP